MAEFVLTIQRGDTRPVQVAFKAGVAGAPLSLAGSSFELTLFNALGELVLTKTGEIGSGVVLFRLTLEEKAALKPGSTGRWKITRTIADQVEPWGAGTTNIVGSA